MFAILLYLLNTVCLLGYGPSLMRSAHCSRLKRTISMNMFGDFFDSGKLKNQKPPSNPIFPLLVSKTPTSYVLNEKLFSLSGEDFCVKDVAGNKIIEIDGGNINLGGFVIDKLAFKDSNGKKFCSLERRIIAATTCYDIYDTKGACIAKIDREMISLTSKYKFYYEGDMNPFPDYYAEGSFLDRVYTFKSGNGEVVGKASRGIEAIRDLDRYQVDVAGGVDAAAILAMAVVIDEDHDEEDQKKSS